MTYSHENGCQLSANGFTSRVFDSHIPDFIYEHIYRLIAFSLLECIESRLFFRFIFSRIPVPNATSLSTNS